MPVAAGQSVSALFASTYANIPLHSTMETSGGIIAVVIAVIIFLKYQARNQLTHYNWGMMALMAMGIIDIFHAVVLPGDLFVWLHSIAVFVGGFFFMSVWIPETRVSPLNYRALPLVFAFFSIVVSFVSILFSEQLPAMFTSDGSFSLTANLLNILGGIGFFVATVKFVTRYLRDGRRNDLFLAGHTLLFGIAGILFAYSSVWDAQWWLWHFLRLSAYLIAFYFLYMEYRREIYMIESNHRKLYTKNEEINKYMTIIDEHVITSTTDTKGIITQVSKAFCRVSGYSEDELIGQSHNIIRHPDMPKKLFRQMWQTIRSGKEWQGEIKNIGKDGRVYWVDTTISPNFDEHGRIIGYTSIRQDISNKKEVELLSITDALTGVYNRRHFNTEFVKEIRRAKREAHYLSLLILDVDHFKLYNDTYGHQKGDDVLKAIGKILLASVRRAGDSAYRLGGEEFGVLFSGLDERASTAFAEQIRDQVSSLQIPHEKSCTSDCVTVSLGLAVGKGAAISDEKTLYKKADDALYAAKEAGRNCIVLVS